MSDLNPFKVVTDAVKALGDCIGSIADGIEKARDAILRTSDIIRERHKLRVLRDLCHVLNIYEFSPITLRCLLDTYQGPDEGTTKLDKWNNIRTELKRVLKSINAATKLLTDATQYVDATILAELHTLLMRKEMALHALSKIERPPGKECFNAMVELENRLYRFNNRVRRVSIALNELVGRMGGEKIEIFSW